MGFPPIKPIIPILPIPPKKRGCRNLSVGQPFSCVERGLILVSIGVSLQELVLNIGGHLLVR